MGSSDFLDLTVGPGKEHHNEGSVPAEITRVRAHRKSEDRLRDALIFYHEVGRVEAP